MIYLPTRCIPLAALLGAFALASCAASPTGTTSATNSTLPATNATSMTANGAMNSTAPAGIEPTTAANSVGAEAGGEGGVEAALVTYGDAAQHFAISHPGTWTQDSTVTNGVQFNGGDSRMRLEFATLSPGTDALTYATQDATSFGGTLTGFKQAGIATSNEVAKAVVLGFEANSTSAVTGKAFAVRGDRYYMPTADGRLAILTVDGPTTRYDREGIRDIALTFKVIK